MQIQPIINIQRRSNYQNQTKKKNDFLSSLNQHCNNSNLNFYYPTFRKNPVLAKSIQAMFPNNKLPESILTKIIWENAESNITKAAKYNLELNPKSYEIFAEIINSFNENLDLNADSKIPNMKNKDLLMSFVKVTQEKKV